MKAVVQRVSYADVVINGEQKKGPIGTGLLVLLGVMEGDTESQAEFLAKKIAGLRVFSDENGKQNLSLQDVDGELMVISNFTLGADCRHGRRPFYAYSASPDTAQRLYEHFLQAAKKEPVKKVESGEFGAHMEIHMTADGPITLVLDTEELMK
jgi:D-tyrosyl-tRNA(Tyr) deacylase